MTNGSRDIVKLMERHKRTRCGTKSLSIFQKDEHLCDCFYRTLLDCSFIEIVVSVNIFIYGSSSICISFKLLGSIIHHLHIIYGISSPSASQLKFLFSITFLTKTNRLRTGIKHDTILS